MAKKKELTSSNLSDDTKQLMQLLSNTHVDISENAIIALNYTEGETDGYITVNHNHTGVKIRLDEYNIHNLAADGIKIWRTWYWNPK